VGRISLFVTIAFVAGLATGFFGRSAGLGTLSRSNSHAADLAAIEKLHQEDVEVTLSQDPKGLIDVWSEDGVRLNPGSPPVVGKQAIEADNEKGRAANPGFKVSEYVPKVKEVLIADEWAIEVVDAEVTYKMSVGDNPVSINGKGMRLLKRQSDGSWKFALVGLK
jgi:ketosteroid isomerase-like protein